MAGGGSQRDDTPITDINMTPLVDVSLVLVIIFMAVAPFAIQAGIQVLHSKASVAKEGKASVDDNVQIVLKEDGSLKINGRAATFAQLASVLQQAIAASKDQMVTVTADDKNKVGQVVEILDTAKQSGAKKLAIMKNETVGPAPTRKT